MGSTEIFGSKGLTRTRNANNQKRNTFFMGNVGLIVLLELYVFKILARVPGICEREHNGSLIYYRYERKRKPDILRNCVVE